MSKVLLASNNKKKLEELRRILEPIVPGIQVLGLADVTPYEEPAETEPTFEGNALLKAHAAMAVTGLPSIADDSGICVDALNGMPGVLSARWAGPPRNDKEGADLRNNELLLAQIDDVPDERRGAHFTCAVAWVQPDGRERVVEGRMDGRIIRELRGNGGFGYDVLFVAQEHDAEGLTSAELEPEEKDRISHRGRALRELAPHVAADLSAAG